MPLASSRKELSFRNIRDGDVNGAPPLAGKGYFAYAEGAEGPRPQSMKTNRSSALWGAATYDESPPATARPLTPSAATQASLQPRFSLKPFRHASDPQLSTHYRPHTSASEASTPPGAPAPVIGITSPAWDSYPERSRRRFNPFAPNPQSFRSKSGHLPIRQGGQGPSSSVGKSPFKSRGSNAGDSNLEQSRSPSVSTNGVAHTLHGDALHTLSVAPARVSASSTSNEASEDRVAHSRPDMLRTVSSNSSIFFRIPKRKKKKKQESLFPLPIKLSPSNPTGSEPSTQNATIIPIQPSSAHTSRSNPSPASETPNHPPRRSAGSHSTTPLSRPSTDGLLAQPLHATFPLNTSPLTRHDSTTSAPVGRSPAIVNSAVERSFRGRSGTTTSFNSRADDERAPTPFHESGGRNSMASTTLGRNSVAGLRSLTSRWRNPSESQSPGMNSPGGFASSKNNSFALSKETLVVPDRDEGETAGKFYSRLETNIPKKSIALSLSKSTDPFHHDVLRSLMRTFKFYEEPMDISLRKFLWEIDLPGEAQQIDRVMSSFAERYHECNPHIFIGFDQAYLAAYSLIILHSDLFNKSNKRKMQRAEYQKNTGGHGIDEEILGYFFDNIQYTEFIAQNLDDDESERKSKKAKARKKVKKIKVATPEGGEKGKLDPYDFILDDRLKLEVLRPALKGAMNLDDTFSYLGSSPSIDIGKIRSAFIQPGILQVISARSRPEAFSSPSTIQNPHEAHPGVVDIRVAKVGVIWRKDPKRKKARSPWQKWGALLTQSQLYFFRNVAWVEDLMKQSEPQHKYGSKRSIVVFRPQIEEFKPDFSLRTATVLALVDTTYDKHKNGFVLASYDGFSDETVIADSEKDMNDWLAKINYCSAFASANIAICQAQSPPKDTLLSVHSPDESSAHLMARQINNARKEAMKTRIGVTEGKIRESQQKVDENLKTARHLQILAPFPPKTRNDLLTFGARMAHRVRWSRFDMWRLKCHREMLTADLEYEGRPRETSLAADGSPIKPISPRISAKANALVRLNSKASAIMNPQKGSKSIGAHSRISASSKLVISQETDLASGIDQAFATPADALSKSASTSDGPFKLPPLGIGSSVFSIESYDTNGPESLNMEIAARHDSTVSEASAVIPLSEKATTPPPSVQERDDENSAEKKRNTAVDSEREQAFGSSPGRSAVRRSLQRTLRDSREIVGNPRPRRQRDSVSTVAHDDSSSREDHETLPRGTGSFKVHGKKASVITLGSEWQGMSAEERLRARKQAQSLDAKADVSPVAEGDGNMSDDMTNEAERKIESAPISESGGGTVSHVESPPKDYDASEVSSDVPLELSAADLGDEPGPAVTDGSFVSTSSDEEGHDVLDEEW